MIFMTGGVVRPDSKLLNFGIGTRSEKTKKIKDAQGRARRLTDGERSVEPQDP
jgi:hypothetical protein